MFVIILKLCNFDKTFIRRFGAQMILPVWLPIRHTVSYGTYGNRDERFNVLFCSFGMILHVSHCTVLVPSSYRRLLSSYPTPVHIPGYRHKKIWARLPCFIIVASLQQETFNLFLHHYDTVQVTVGYGNTGTYGMSSNTVQLDRVRMTLETLVRSSGPHAPPTTLRAFFDSPG